MSKKKPVDKRLNKLFDNITPEETTSKPKRTVRKEVVEEKIALPPAKVEPISPRTRPVEIIKPAPGTSKDLSLAFQAGQNNWATLQVVDDTEQRKWSPDDELLVRQVADQLSLALENAQLFKETQLRAEELAVLNEVGQALAATLNIEQITETTYRGIARLFDAKNFYIAFYDEENNEVTFPHNVTESVIDRSIIRLPLSEGITSHMIRTRESIMIRDGSDKWMAEHGEIPVGEPAKSFLGVPMMLGEKVLGALAIQDYETPKRYDEHDLRLLNSFACQAAIAIENARLFEEAQRRAQETSALAEVGREISSTLDLEIVL